MNIEFHKDHVNIALEDGHYDLIKVFFITYTKYFPDLEKIRKAQQAKKSGVSKKTLNARQLYFVNKTIAELKKIINRLKDNSYKINLTCGPLSTKEISDFIFGVTKMKKELSLISKIRSVMTAHLETQLLDFNELAHDISNFDFASYKHRFLIGGGFRLQFQRESILYKSIKIYSNSPITMAISREEGDQKDVRNVLNVLAFLYVQPNFILSENTRYNQKLANLYSEFDLTELITLGNKKFFNDATSKLIDISVPLFKLDKARRTITFQAFNHDEVFNLYHSSLKQLEPVPRCVFLFRIIEFARKHHYILQVSSQNPTWSEIIKYYYEKSLTHNFIPIYYFDSGNIYNKSNDIINKYRKAGYYNLTIDLKKQSKKIANIWSKHPFLSGKSIGDIVYSHGRNPIAHGGNDQHNVNYDYANKYLHTNNVNVFLELISRYIIELFNPQLRKHVYLKKGLYLKNSTYLGIINSDSEKPDNN